MNLLCLNIYLKFSEYFEKLKFEFSRFYCIMLNRLVVIFQETARNHFWEAGMLMQSYMLQTVQ